MPARQGPAIKPVTSKKERVPVDLTQPVFERLKAYRAYLSDHFHEEYDLSALIEAMAVKVMDGDQHFANWDGAQGKEDTPVVPARRRNKKSDAVDAAAA